MKNLGIGKEKDGLYFLDEHAKENSVKCNNSVNTFYLSKKLWHCRLGHPSEQVLNVLKDKINVQHYPNLSPCDTCHCTKQLERPSLP